MIGAVCGTSVNEMVWMVSKEEELFDISLYIYTMDALFLYLLFSWMGLGKLLCIGKEERMDQQRVPSWSLASDLRKWSNYCSDLDDRSEGSYRSCISVRDDRCNDSRIRYRGVHGAAIQGALLGLQPSAVEHEWLYLPSGFPRVGSILGTYGSWDSYSD